MNQLLGDEWPVGVHLFAAFRVSQHMADRQLIHFEVLADSIAGQAGLFSDSSDGEAIAAIIEHFDFVYHIPLLQGVSPQIAGIIRAKRPFFHQRGGSILLAAGGSV